MSHLYLCLASAHQAIGSNSVTSGVSEETLFTAVTCEGTDNDRDKRGKTVKRISSRPLSPITVSVTNNPLLS